MDFLNDLFRASLGVTVLLGICYLLSSDRKAINWRLVTIGMGLQLMLAFFILIVPGVSSIFDWISKGFTSVIAFTAAGSQFMFGNIVTDMSSFGYIFAFQVLPTIVFFSALTAVLYYLGILQKIVYGLAWLLTRTMGLSGPESLAAAANVFIGQTEAPLVVKPYLEKMTKSEILCLMTGGMATIAGSVFVAYVGYLGGTDEATKLFFAKHLLTASIISAPAAIVAAKMLFPETERDEDLEKQLEMADGEASNLLDAISRGTTDGLRLAVNVGAMLLVFTAMIFMMNEIFLSVTDLLNGAVAWFNPSVSDWNEQISLSTGGRFEGFSFTYLLAMVFAPFAWILGVPFEDITVVGQLLGLKTVINEFVAYEQFQGILVEGLLKNEKSVIIATYALCGFSNFASIGIQIGGIGSLAPGQRNTLTSFGIKALIGGTIACFLTGAIAGLFI
ncbi:NupC/NupG family nucleoside CNT transporter [Lewinella cohaerens]|uniref:NupC/NupG family nucleoside CNT transporter n=1 Tax=Lewinella cohaerens TaxID=70995 RepID=UPI000364C9D0|nr:nucleoside transporter C-terminal domain-containing protein [Lewinella cohaerens]